LIDIIPVWSQWTDSAGKYVEFLLEAQRADVGGVRWIPIEDETFHGALGSTHLEATGTIGARYHFTPPEEFEFLTSE